MKMILALFCALLLCSCSAPAPENQPAPPASPQAEDSAPDLQQQLEEQTAQAQQELEEQTAQAQQQLEESLPQPEAAAEPEPYLICIDAGHQSKGSSKKEPNGPGSSQMKARVTGGTRGTTTGLYEYELNLQVSLKLQQVLEERGYEVLMVRTTNDVDISNAERSQVANDANADAFIRIHANGSENSKANGAITICQTPENPYNAALYEPSRRLSELVLDGLVNATGAKREKIWETDTMTGINWSQVPATIVEMGYMTNPTEDRNMASEDYQWKLAQGIADGIDNYFAAEDAQG